MPQQDTTVYLDFADAAETCAAELWSDASASDDAGTGLVLEIGPSRGLIFYGRAGNIYTPTNGPTRRQREAEAPLIKGLARRRCTPTRGTERRSSQPRGLQHLGRPRFPGWERPGQQGCKRGVKRINVVRAIPAGPFTLREDPSWSSDWKVFQRDGQERATIPVRFFYRQVAAGRAQARVVDAGTTNVLPGHNYTDHQLLLPAAGAGAAELAVVNVPTGGNYDVQVRLVRDSDNAVLGESSLSQIAVGDVYVAAGQSNMSGRGDLSGIETPSPSTCSGTTAPGRA
jgi:hypothetical protein